MPSHSDLNMSAQGGLVRDQLHLLQVMDTEWMGRSEEGENGKMKQEEIRAHPLLLDFMDAGWMGSDEGPKERNAEYKEEQQSLGLRENFMKDMSGVQARGRSLADVHPMLLQMMDSEWMGSHNKRMTDVGKSTSLVYSNVRQGSSHDVNPLLLDMMDSAWIGSGVQTTCLIPQREREMKTLYEITPVASEDEIQAHYKKFAAERAFETLEKAMDGLWAGPAGQNVAMKIGMIPRISAARHKEKPQSNNMCELGTELLDLFENAWYGRSQKEADEIVYNDTCEEQETLIVPSPCLESPTRHRAGIVRQLDDWWGNSYGLTDATTTESMRSHPARQLSHKMGILGQMSARWSG